MTHGGGVAGPRPMEHEPQPEKSHQHQLVEKERGNHGKTPSYRWRDERIVPGFQVAGISRRLAVHARILSSVKYPLTVLSSPASESPDEMLAILRVPMKQP